MPLAPIVTAGIIAGGASTLNTGGGIINGALNRKENRRVRAEDRAWALQDYQTQRNDALDDWHMQNEYNSPDAQRRRLEEAGYNPALALGDVNSVSAAGDPNAVNDISSPTQGAYEMPTPQLDFASSFSQMAGALNTLETLKGTTIDNARKIRQQGWDDQIKKNDAEASSLMIKQMETGVKLDYARIEYTNQLTRVQAEIEKLTQSQTAATDQSIEESKARVTNLSSQSYLNNQLSSESQSRQGEIGARIEYLQKQKETLEADLRWVDEMKRTQIGQQLAAIGLSNSKKRSQDIDNRYKERTGSDTNSGGIAGYLFRLGASELPSMRKY